MNAINQLEDLKDMIAADKASILLVHGNLKPAALVVMQGAVFALTEQPDHVNAASITRLEGILSAFGLYYTSTTTIMENSSGRLFDHGQEVMRIFIARDQDTAEELRVAFDDIEHNHAKAGTLLGYPKTAVAAFLTPDMLEWKDHPTWTKDVSVLNMRLLGHRLSKDNWREEVKYLEPSGSYLQSVSLKIYNEAVGINDLYDGAIQADKDGTLTEWMINYLQRSGRNKSLASGLKEDGRFHTGLIDYPIEKFKILMGPNHSFLYYEEPEKFNSRVESMVASLRIGWKPVPFIASDLWNDGLELNDGAHRAEALKRYGLKTYPTVFYFKDQLALSTFRESLRTD